MDTVACTRCSAATDPLAVFPGGICLACHEKQFDAEVRLTGVLPKPNFTGTLTAATRSWRSERAALKKRGLLP